jgi:hypothetical protein
MYAGIFLLRKLGLFFFIIPMAVLAGENERVDLELQNGVRFMNCQIVETNEDMIFVQIPFVDNTIQIPKKQIRSMTTAPTPVKSSGRSLIIYGSAMRPFSNQSALQTFFPFFPSIDIMAQWGNVKSLPWLGNITSAVNGLFLNSNAVSYQIYHLFMGTTYEKNITASGAFSLGCSILLGPGYNKIQGYNGNAEFITLAAQAMLFSSMRIGKNAFLLGMQIGYNYDKTYIFFSGGVSMGLRFFF